MGSGTILLTTLLVVSAFLLIPCRIAELFTERRAKSCEQQRTKKQSHGDGLSRLLAPSVLSVCICAVCLCGASWAWFTASTSTSTTKIQSAAYTVSVTAKQGAAEVPATAAEGGATAFALEAGKEYQIEITPTGNATAGYCKVNFEDKDYYTAQCASGPLSFTVYASDNGTLTVTPEWGTCAVAGEDTAIKNGGEIGTKAAQPSPTDDTAAEPSDTAPQPAAPEDTTPEEETTSVPDAPSAMPESSANEE